MLFFVLSLLLSLFVIKINACTTMEKVKCTAAYVGCGAICACDIPACECCVPCLACVTATSADCCECLFPGWSGCSNMLLMAKIKNATIKGPASCASTVCCNGAQHISRCCESNQTADCRCGTSYHPDKHDCHGGCTCSRQ